MNPRRCSTPLFAWREAIVDAELGPQSLRLGPGAVVSRRTQVAVAVGGLSLHMNEKGSQCWPSVRRLAGEIGLHERTVQRANEALRRQGFLAIVRGGGRRRTNRYEIRLPGRVKAALLAAATDAGLVAEQLELKGGPVPPFLQKGWPGVPERVAVDTEKGGTVPPEVLSRSTGGPPPRASRAPWRSGMGGRDDSFEAGLAPSFDSVVFLADARARRARAELVEEQPAAEPPVWTLVWWWSRARGETRVFPQLASPDASPSGDQLGWPEYERLEADWRSAGSPVQEVDPRILAATINFSLTEV